jgi:hypothetical protein
MNSVGTILEVRYDALHALCLRRLDLFGSAVTNRFDLVLGDGER